MDYFFVDLMRHGEPEGGKKFRGHLDDPLSSLGWQQARANNHYAQWQLITSSPLARCANYAHELAKELSVECTIDEQFKEVNFGCWEGLTPKQVEQQHPGSLQAFWSKPLEHFPEHGEGLQAFYERIEGRWLSFSAHTPAKNQLLVCHGGVIRAILCSVLGVSLDNFWAVEVEYASITRIEITRSEHGVFCRLLEHAANLKG